ncbi:hypothetical protein DFJ73DRAFT_800639 [Zopfochytrium polystomum]|nr:hypothetical protein DFJ73DRAFT_800639 [Zopfochytrium polystomum]
MSANTIPPWDPNHAHPQHHQQQQEQQQQYHQEYQQQFHHAPLNQHLPHQYPVASQPHPPPPPPLSTARLAAPPSAAASSASTLSAPPSPSFAHIVSPSIGDEKNRRPSRSGAGPGGVNIYDYHQLAKQTDPIHHNDPMRSPRFDNRANQISDPLRAGYGDGRTSNDGRVSNEQNRLNTSGQHDRRPSNDGRISNEHHRANRGGASAGQYDRRPSNDARVSNEHHRMNPGGQHDGRVSGEHQQPRLQKQHDQREDLVVPSIHVGDQFHGHQQPQRYSPGHPAYSNQQQPQQHPQRSPAHPAAVWGLPTPSIVQPPLPAAGMSMEMRPVVSGVGVGDLGAQPPPPPVPSAYVIGPGFTPSVNSSAMSEKSRDGDSAADIMDDGTIKPTKKKKKGPWVKFFGRMMKKYWQVMIAAHFLFIAFNCAIALSLSLIVDEKDVVSAEDVNYTTLVFTKWSSIVSLVLWVPAGFINLTVKFVSAWTYFVQNYLRLRQRRSRFWWWLLGVNMTQAVLWTIVTVLFWDANWYCTLLGEGAELIPFTGTCNRLSSIWWYAAFNTGAILVNVYLVVAEELDHTMKESHEEGRASAVPEGSILLRMTPTPSRAPTGMSLRSVGGGGHHGDV